MTHLVDLHVGKRIRYRRWHLGLSQTELGNLVGVRFQQIQKYEIATNRVSASRLWDIAHALKVPVSFFFEGLEAADQNNPPHQGQGDGAAEPRTDLST